MHAAVVDEWDRPAFDRYPVELGRRDASTSPQRIKNCDLIAGPFEPPHDLIFGPGRRNARVDAERIAAPSQPEHAFETRTIHPGCGSGVPAPAAAAGMRRSRVQIAGDHIRL